MPEIRVQDEQGTVHVFPDGTTPEMIAGVLHVKPPVDPQSFDAHPIGPNPNDLLDSLGRNIKSTADDLYTGGVKKFGQGIATISSGLNKLPWVGETLAPKVGVNSFQQQMQPDNTTQKVGGALEQAGEMALTGGPLKAGAGKLATMLPFLGKFAAPAARVGAEALNVGSNAALHGEPVGPAAAFGAGGAAVGELGQAVAPKMVQKALGIFGKDMQHGQTPGAAILQETSGIRPATIAKQASKRSGQLTQQMEAGVNAATQQGTMVSSNPAHQIIDNAIAKAPRNAPTYTEKLKSLKGMLNLDGTGRRDFTPDEALEMKRGIDKEVRSWDRDVRQSVDPIKRQVYGAIDRQLDNAVPGNDQANQKISSLITGTKAAKATDMGRRRGLVSQLVQKGAAPTLGAALGYKEGGAGGAALGAVAASAALTPEAQIAFARMVKSGMPVVLARGLAAQVSAENTAAGR